jgi:hypothetical protein
MKQLKARYKKASAAHTGFRGSGGTKMALLFTEIDIGVTGFQFGQLLQVLP